jgi:polyisoprenyl-phosphate glycosyltransferase
VITRDGAADVELSIVVPAYEEADGLTGALRAIASAARRASPRMELLVVDDGSRDRTWTAICANQTEIPELRAIRLSRNFGKEAAMFAGLAEARGRAVMVMDADLQHPPEMLPAFVQAWREGAGDVIDGVKRGRQREGLVRRALSATFNNTITAFTGYRFKGNSDFKLLDRHVVDAILSMAESRTFFRGMVEWTGFRHHVIAYDVAPRQAGSSHWSLLSLLRLAGRAIISYSALPLRLIHVATAIFFLLAFASGARVAWQYAQGGAPTGVTTSVAVLLSLGACLLLALGIIAEYVAAIYEEVKRRPRYVIAERYEATHDVSATTAVGHRETP